MTPTLGQIPRLAKRAASSHTVMIAGGSAAGQGLVVLVTPILTRTYSTTEFAFLAVYTSIALILGPFITLRLDMALTLPRSDEDATSVAWMGVTAATIIASILTAIGTLLGEPLSRMLNSPHFGNMAWLVGIGVLILALDQIALAWMVRNHQYKNVAVRNIASGIVQASTQVVFGFASIPNGLVLGLVAGKTISIFGMALADGLFTKPRPSRTTVRTNLRRYRRFLYLSSWSTLLNGVGVQGPILVISACYGSTAVAALGLATRVLSAPLAIVGTAASRVFQGKVSEALRSSQPVVQLELRRTVLLLASLGIVPAAALLLFGPSLFELVFGSNWRLAGELASLLALGLYAQFIVSPIGPLPTLLERHRLQLTFDISRGATTIGLPLAVYSFGGSLNIAILMLTASLTATYAGLLLMANRLAAHIDRETAGQQAILANKRSDCQ